jgi:hypothetical protein
LDAGSVDDLEGRDRAFRLLVDASHVHDEANRRQMVGTAATTLGSHAVYEANMVIALFNFYNKWIDLNGVAPLSTDA